MGVYPHPSGVKRAARGYEVAVTRLRRSDCAGPGYTRRRAGRGFIYLDAEGRRVVDDGELERIRSLAIPPAWSEVWICPQPNGHLQATGVDAAGRKQYRYHDDWRTRRDAEKFDAMLDFAAALPPLRRQLIGDLRKREMSRDRVLACALRMLDLGFFRIGSEDYAEENDSFGLATLRREHLAIDGAEARFDYAAKSGVRQVQTLRDPAVLRVLKALKARRGGGEELLAYKLSGRWVDVKSTDVNARLVELTGGEFSAKDFRTWSGTVLAAVSIAGKREHARTRSSRSRAKAAAAREVAYFLGNTPAVARKSYIDPRVFDRFDSGWTIAARIEELGGPEAFIDPEGRIAIEDAVRDLIEDRRSESPALEKVAVKRA